MKQRIVYEENGQVKIICPAKGADIEKIAESLPSNVAYRVLNSDEVPQDREYRDAWTLDFGIDKVKKAKVDERKKEDELKKVEKTVLRELAIKKKGIFK